MSKRPDTAEEYVARRQVRRITRLQDALRAALELLARAIADQNGTPVSDSEEADLARLSKVLES